MKTACEDAEISYLSGVGVGVTVLVVRGGVSVGVALGNGVGVAVLVVCGCVPKGDALGNGVIVAVGTGVVCNGVTVAVGRGPAGTLGLGKGVMAFGVSLWAKTALPNFTSKTRPSSTASIPMI